MQIVLVNGPPRSGKDTFGEMLRQELEGVGRAARIRKFAGPLKDATAELYRSLTGISESVSLLGLYEGPAKDLPSPSFLGVTPRQALIAVSEKLLKPLHGDDVFGRLAADTVRDLGVWGVEFVIFTDSGFESEASVLIEEFGKDSVLLVRMRRDGCTFDGDSRSYLTLPGVCAADVDNNGSMADLRRSAHLLAAEIR